MTRTFKTDHFSHSSQNLMGESQEHWSLHVADFVCDRPPVFFFAKVSLVSLPLDFYPNCQGGSWMYSPFLKCCTVMSTYTSQKPLLWFALLFFTPNIFDIQYEIAAPSCSSSSSKNSEVANSENPQKAGVRSFCIDLGPPCTCRYFFNFSSRLVKPNITVFWRKHVLFLRSFSV